MIGLAGRLSVPEGEDPADEVVIVAARAAWPLYQQVGAYITQNERSIRPTRRMGFYANRTVYPALPVVLHRHDNVMIDEANAARLLLGLDPVDQRLGAVIRGAIDHGWDEGLRTVVVLTALDDPRTLRRSELHHDGTGAYAMGQRYSTLGRLLAADTTADL